MTQTHKDINEVLLSMNKLSMMTQYYILKSLRTAAHELYSVLVANAYALYMDVMRDMCGNILDELYTEGEEELLNDAELIQDEVIFKERQTYIDFWKELI